MKVLAVPKLTRPSYNYTDGFEATGFSSDDDFCDEEAPGPPIGSSASTRNWEICEYIHKYDSLSLVEGTIGVTFFIFSKKTVFKYSTLRELFKTSILECCA